MRGRHDWLKLLVLKIDLDAPDNELDPELDSEELDGEAEDEKHETASCQADVEDCDDDCDSSGASNDEKAKDEEDEADGDEKDEGDPAPARASALEKRVKQMGPAEEDSRPRCKHGFLQLRPGMYSSGSEDDKPMLIVESDNEVDAASTHNGKRDASKLDKHGGDQAEKKHKTATRPAPAKQALKEKAATEKPLPLPSSCPSANKEAWARVRDAPARLGTSLGKKKARPAEIAEKEMADKIEQDTEVDSDTASHYTLKGDARAVDTDLDSEQDSRSRGSASEPGATDDDDDDDADKHAKNANDDEVVMVPPASESDSCKSQELGCLKQGAPKAMALSNRKKLLGEKGVEEDLSQYRRRCRRTKKDSTALKQTSAPTTKKRERPDRKGTPKDGWRKTICSREHCYMVLKKGEPSVRFTYIYGDGASMTKADDLASKEAAKRNAELVAKSKETQKAEKAKKREKTAKTKVKT